MYTSLCWNAEVTHSCTVATVYIHMYVYMYMLELASTTAYMYMFMQVAFYCREVWFYYMHVCTCTHKRYMYTCRYDMFNQNYAHTLHRTLSHVALSDSHYHVTHPMVKGTTPAVPTALSKCMAPR